MNKLHLYNTNEAYEDYIDLGIYKQLEQQQGGYSDEIQEIVNRHGSESKLLSKVYVLGYFLAN